MCRNIQDHDDPRYCCDCHLDEEEFETDADRDGWIDAREMEYLADIMKEGEEATNAANEEETSPLEAGP